MQLPMMRPLTPFIFSRGAVIAMSGSWATIPINATPVLYQQELQTMIGGLTNDIMRRYTNKQFMQNP